MALGSLEDMPALAFMLFCRAGLFAWVAATRSGFTPCAAGWLCGPGFWGLAGVVVPPVARGVDREEGISEVKIVPEDGERTYFWVMVERSA